MNNEKLESEIIKQINEFPGSVSYLLIRASGSGDEMMAKILLADSRVDPAISDNYCIRVAARLGHTDIVKLLLKDPRVNPADLNNYAVKWAIENEHKKAVKILLNSLGFRFNFTHFTEISSKISKEIGGEINKEIRELLICHFVKCRMYLRSLLVQHLTIDLMPQISCFIAIN